MSLIKLKKISLFNFLLFVFTIFTFFYVKNYIENEKYYSKYNLKNSVFKGYIKNKKVYENKIVYYIDDLIINDYNMKNEYEIGDYVKIKGDIKRPDKNTIPYTFNYQNYLYSLNIHYIVNLKSIEKINKNVPFYYKIKRNLKKYLLKYKRKDYMLTFIIGENYLLNNDTKTSYNKNGISHLFSISGMHIAILSSILLFILNKFFDKKHSLIFIYLFFGIYLFITNFSKSIIRASFLFFIVTITDYFKIKVSKIKLFYLFFLVMLIINPYNIYNMSFKFSYTITFFLLLFKDIINKYHNYFIKIFVTSFISFLASLPILINSNYEINILSIFLNIIFVPFVSLIVFPLSLIILFIKPLEFIFDFLLIILENISFIFINYKITIILSKINNTFFVIYYLLIYFVLLSIKKGKYKYIIIIIIAIFFHYHINYFNNEINITYFDVKQGDSILINYKNNKETILIDTGGVKDYDISSGIINYLKAMGIRKISYLILTHGDYDHMGEAINLVNNFKVEKVIFNCGEYNDLEKELIKVLDKKKIKYYSCIKELNIDKNKLYFLQTKEYDNENDNSNVIYTELNDFKFMFMGDASTTTEKEILSKYNLSDVDVLKVGHHGSKTSSSREFINEVNPNYSIISVGKNNRYGHPNKEVLDNLKISKIYRTDQDGSIMFKIKNKKLKIETCSP